MRITLNLASRPFFELRPVLLRLRIIAGALVVLALALFLLLRRAEVKADQAQAVVHRWTVASQQLQQEWQQDQALMRQPVNAATLDRSEFLNQLFIRKSFSWTTALMDLELVLPQGVQVMSIDPQMTKEGQVLIHLRVNGPRDKAVELVSNMEKSPHFLQPRVVGETSQVEGEHRAGFRPTMSASTDVNVDILAAFNAGDLASTDVKAEEKKSDPCYAGSNHSFSSWPSHHTSPCADTHTAESEPRRAMKLSRPNWTNIRITAQHWHYAALIILILLNATLAVRLAIAWNRSQAGNAARVQAQRSEYEAMQLKTRPLRGLTRKMFRPRRTSKRSTTSDFPITTPPG